MDYNLSFSNTVSHSIPQCREHVLLIMIKIMMIIIKLQATFLGTAALSFTILPSEHYNIIAQHTFLGKT